MSEPATWDIFLCHNRADKDWTRSLGEKIEAEKWGDRNLRVFFDEWDIGIGQNIPLSISRGLRESRFVGVVLSPEMLASDWCAAEFTALIAEDPVNRSGKLIPLLCRRQSLDGSKAIELPSFILPLNWLDFSDPRDFKRCFARLVAVLKGEPPPRGGSRSGRPGQGAHTEAKPIVPALPEGRHEPDPISETLFGNVLPVTVQPTAIWSHPTVLSMKSEIPFDTDLPPFILRERKIFTFTDLSRPDTPFAPFFSTGTWERHALVTWRTNPAKWAWVIELLKTALTRHLRRHSILLDRATGRYVVRPTKARGSRFVQWGSGSSCCILRAPTEGAGYWVHRAARLWFHTLGTRIFLSVRPTWTFTTNGRDPAPKEKLPGLNMQWGGRERNGSILGHVLMWSDILTQGGRMGLIFTGDKPIVIGRLPASIRMPVGLADDQVSVRALLAFTKAELELGAESASTFAFIDASGAPSEGEIHA